MKDEWKTPAEALEILGPEWQIHNQLINGHWCWIAKLNENRVPLRLMRIYSGLEHSAAKPGHVIMNTPMLKYLKERNEAL